MTPPVFALAAADPAVAALLGAAPTRFFLFGMAPQAVAKPYAVWQQVGGSPENYLGDRPDVDSVTIQIDAYADDPRQTRQVVEALRDALEPHAHVTAWLGESQDPQTRHWRSTFRLDWWVPR